MLFKILFLDHFRKTCCWNHWFYNISQHNVAEIIGLTTFQTKQLLKHLTGDISKNNVGKTIDFTTFPKPEQLQYLTVDLLKDNVAKTTGSINISLRSVVKPLVLAALFSKML